MASNAELLARIEAIEAVIDGAVVIPDFAISVLDSEVVIGSYVYGTKAGINNGKFFQGYVQTVSPPTADAHINFTYKLA